MKRLFWGVVVLACAYGILVYAVSNPRGAKDAAESAKKYVDNLSDDEQEQ